MWIVTLGLALLAMNEADGGTDTVVLVDGGEPLGHIVIPDTTDTRVRIPAALLRDYVQRATGVLLPVVDAPRAGDGPAVAFFLASHAPDGAPYGRDGFTVTVDPGGVRFVAATSRGLRNAVVGFLERELGCRRYSVDVEVVPHVSTITIPFGSLSDIPPLSFRMQDFKDPGYTTWHGLNRLDEWGLFVHTFHELVPPERYFEEHPEYYSLRDGRRNPAAQLCLSNEDVFEIVVAELRRRMAVNPDAHYWSVSQNDITLPCTCAECAAFDSVEGAHSGSIVRFVNCVAAEFPDKTISTLAYQYSRKAPARTRPAPNVNIMLCSIECDRSQPIAADTSAGSFASDVRAGGALTDNIFLWDYVIQFRNLVSPFPNLHVLQPNLQFFVENGITAVFEQGLPVMHGEFAELRAYLLSKLLWDPYVDVDSVMTDFLDGYYGNAGPIIQRYIDEMHAARARSDETLDIYGYPWPSEDGYLSGGMIDRYSEIFDEAELAVADDRELLTRVQTARLPVQYARLEQAKRWPDGERGCFSKDADGRRSVRPGIEALADSFFVRCERAGIPRLWEHGVPPDAYHEATRRFLHEGVSNHKALGASVALATPASVKYHGGDASTLADGLSAWDDYHMHWLGFEGDDMTAVVDLGAEVDVSRIETAFLQDLLSWIWVPQQVEVAVSLDDVAYETVASLPSPLAVDQPGPVRVPVMVEVDPRPARYVRVRAESVRQCPDWHKGAGGPAWVFCDEIRVY